MLSQHASKEAQKAVLSLILCYGNDAVELVEMDIEERHFSEVSYQLMWRSIMYLYNNKHNVDRITVENSMRVQRDSNNQVAFELLDPQRGNHFEKLLEIEAFKSEDKMSTITSYSAIMQDKYNVGVAQKMANELLKMTRDGNATHGQVQVIIDKYAFLYSEQDRKQPRSASDIVKVWKERIKSSDENDDLIIRPDIPFLDSYLWLTPTNVTVIAGDSGSGKTSLALQIAIRIALQKKVLVDMNTGKAILGEDGNKIYVPRRVAFFGFEMTAEENLAKIACAQYNMDFETLMSLPKNKKIAILDRFEKDLKRVAPGFIIDCTCDTLKDIKNKTKALIKSGAIDIGVVDYMQLVKGQKSSPSESEETTIRNTSRFFKKELATEFESHWIILSQLRKPDPTATDFRPTRDRLYGSSAIYQDATNVLFTYRDWANKIATKKDPKTRAILGSTLYLAEIIMDKCRFGMPNVTIDCGFVPYMTYFVPLKFIEENNLLHERDMTKKLPNGLVKVWEGA